MKVTVQRAILVKPLQMISGVVEKRQTLPILSNVLVSVQDQTLSLTATDLEIELIGTMPVEEVSQAGSTTVSARKLLDICRALPDDAIVKVSLEGEQLILRSGTFASSPWRGAQPRSRLPSAWVRWRPSTSPRGKMWCPP